VRIHTAQPDGYAQTLLNVQTVWPHPMKTSSPQHTPSHQTAYTTERHVYEAIPESQRRQRIATSAYYKAKPQGYCGNRELDGWLHTGSGLSQQTAE